MAEPRTARMVCLNGFMGCGKSTVGKLLARRVGWIHVDLDQRIVETAKLSIPEIFSQHGEPEFRRIEHEQLKRTFGEAEQQGLSRLVSLGGGTIMQPPNYPLLKQPNVIMVWLRCPVEVLLSRIAHIQDRPLFRDEASFRKLYAERLPFYKTSHYKVDASVEPEQVAEQILNLRIFSR
jgi:shikimate kinase